MYGCTVRHVLIVEVMPSLTRVVALVRVHTSYDGQVTLRFYGRHKFRRSFSLVESTKTEGVPGSAINSVYYFTSSSTTST